MEKAYILTRQETSYFCVPAVLQAVFRRRKIHMSQRDIANRIGCTENGTRFEKIPPNFFKSIGLGFCFCYYNETPFNEPDLFIEDALKEGKDVVMGYSTVHGLHSVIVSDFADPKVRIIDPADCLKKEENFYKILEEMYRRNDGGFAAISNLEKRVN